jgi:hypothetical protein
VGAPAVVGIEEGLQTGASSVLDLRERWPAGQEVAEQHGVTLLKPVQSVRIVLLEGIGQAIGEARFVADQLTTVFSEAEQCAHAFALRLQRGKSLRVSHEKIQSKFGIGWIVLGAAGREGLTVLGQGQRVDGKEHKEVVFLQCVDDRTLSAVEQDSIEVGFNAQNIDYGSCRVYRTNRLRDGGGCRCGG